MCNVIGIDEEEMAKVAPCNEMSCCYTVELYHVIMTNHLV